MRSRLFLYFLLFSLPLNAQGILRQGAVHYHISTSTLPASPDTVSLLLLFTPDRAALSMTQSQEPGSGSFLVLNYQKNQSQGFIYNGSDTTAAAVTTIPTKTGKEYELTLPPNETKTILGYRCQHFVLTPKGNKKSADRISGWITDRIKTQAVPIIDLYNQLPGFPLEISRRDGGSGATILFTADQLLPLDSGQLEAYSYYVQRAALPKQDLVRQAAEAFDRDSALRLAMPVLPGWTIVKNSYRELSLQHDGFKARLLLRRSAPKAHNEVEIQLEKLADRSGGYLRDALHLPAPALDFFTFRDQPAVQRTWRYPNARNYIFHNFPQGKNPYDYFPLIGLVEVQRAFLMGNVLYELQVQTVEKNYEPVMLMVENMLEQAMITGE